MKLRNIILFVATFLIASFLATKTVSAAENHYELKNQIGTQARCEADSDLMQDNNYKIIFSCRNLDYPGGEQVSYYIAWGNPADGGSTIKLGDLGFGKAEFQTNKALSTLFVTRETNRGANNPSGNTVMRAEVQKSDFLGSNQVPENTPNPTNTQATPIPVAKTSPVNLGQLFKTAAIAGVLGLVALIALIFFLIKPR